MYVLCSLLSQRIHYAQLSLLVSDVLFVLMGVGLSVMFGCWGIDGGETRVMSDVVMAILV